MGGRHGRTGQTEQDEEIVEAAETEVAALQVVRQADPDPQGMEHRSGRPPPLLEQPSRGDASGRAVLVVGVRPDGHEVPADRLGDLIIVLLCADGYDPPARVVADLVEITNDYLDRLPR
jgi:hypothetical protein